MIVVTITEPFYQARIARRAGGLCCCRFVGFAGRAVLDLIPGAGLPRAGQVYAAVILVTLFLCLQIYVKPYESTVMNVLDITALLTLWATLVLSILFWRFGEKNESTHESVISGVILLCNGAMLSAFVFAIVRTPAPCRGVGDGRRPALGAHFLTFCAVAPCLVPAAFAVPVGVPRAPACRPPARRVPERGCVQA